MTSATIVREHPLLFTAEMVRALLEGKKTQTRRVAKLPDDVVIDRWGHPFRCVEVPGGWHREGIACPHGDPGDRLWVRERHVLVADAFGIVPGIVYHADKHARWNVPMPDGLTVYNYSNPEVWKSRPSIFLRREHSRITLELTGNRIERVQDISEADAEAEGVVPCFTRHIHYDGGAYRCEYQHVWDALNSKRGYGWFTNPWVWVLEFRRVS